jgi:competence protein ComEC
LLCGILLGIDWNIPDNLIEAYRACGVLHIIAISGFNIALISSLVIRLTRTFFSSGKAGLIAILTILTYTLLVGAEPAVVRAAIMGSLAIPAHYFGRRVIALHSLVIVAAMMLVGNPFLLWDISFQLSFLACLGLTTMVDPLVKWIDNGVANHLSEEVRQWWRSILVMVVSTLIAQFCAAPALFEMNPQFSLWTLPANLALAIVQPLLMALGGSSLICGFFFRSWVKFWPMLPGLSGLL